jgi:hypothetical protein
MKGTDSVETEGRSPHVVTMKLDAEDYENIYLRVREKLWFFWASLFGVLGGTGLLITYFSIGTATEAAVDKYVQTERFAKSIAENTESRLARLEAREKELNSLLAGAEKRVGALAKLPIAISEHGVTLVDANGEKFHIETGQARRGDVVEFHSAFGRPPMVLIASMSDRFGRPAADPMATSRDVPVVHVIASSTGFRVPHNFTRGDYSWIAVGP